MRTMRWGALFVAVLVGMGLLAPPDAHASTTLNHKLTMYGHFVETLVLGQDAFAGRAVDQRGFNRNVVYYGNSSYPEEDAYSGSWSGGRFTLVERDGSRLTVKVDGQQPHGSAWRDYGLCVACEITRNGRVVVVGGTGKFAGASGSGWAHLESTFPIAPKLEGNLWLTLN